MASKREREGDVVVPSPKKPGGNAGNRMYSAAQLRSCLNKYIPRLLKEATRDAQLELSEEDAALVARIMEPVLDSPPVSIRTSVSGFHWNYAGSTETEFAEFKEVFELLDELIFMRVKAACEARVAAYVQTWKEQEFATTPICFHTKQALDLETARVVYHPPFERLVKDFLENAKIKLSTLEVTVDGELADSGLLKDFAAYHRVNASMHLMSPKGEDLFLHQLKRKAREDGDESYDSDSSDSIADTDSDSEASRTGEAVRETNQPAGEPASAQPGEVKGADTDPQAGKQQQQDCRPLIKAVVPPPASKRLRRFVDNAVDAYASSKSGSQAVYEGWIRAHGNDRQYAFLFDPDAPGHEYYKFRIACIDHGWSEGAVRAAAVHAQGQAKHPVPLERLVETIELEAYSEGFTRILRGAIGKDGLDSALKYFLDHPAAAPLMVREILTMALGTPSQDHSINLLYLLSNAMHSLSEMIKEEASKVIFHLQDANMASSATSRTDLFTTALTACKDAIEKLFTTTAASQTVSNRQFMHHLLSLWTGASTFERGPLARMHEALGIQLAPLPEEVKAEEKEKSDSTSKNDTAAPSQSSNASKEPSAPPATPATPTPEPKPKQEGKQTASRALAKALAMLKRKKQEQQQQPAEQYKTSS